MNNDQKSLNVTNFNAKAKLWVVICGQVVKFKFLKKLTGKVLGD